MFSFKKILLGLLISGTALGTVQAQAGQEFGAPSESGQPQKSYPPVHKIAEGDRMFSKRIWRAIDLREKQNRPLFSKGREITKVIIDAVKRGELTAYKDDSLEAGTTFTREEFLEKLLIPQANTGPSEAEKAAGLTGWDDGGWDDGESKEPINIAAEYFPHELYTMELMEDVVFDKKRSRMYNQIQALTMKIPADKHPGGILLPIATFKYEDLVRVFQNDPNAVWFNAQNDAQHKNMSEAFELRLFNSYIVQVSNPVGDRIADASKQGLYAAQRVQEDLIEFEYSLWSY